MSLFFKVQEHLTPHARSEDSHCYSNKAGLQKPKWGYWVRFSSSASVYLQVFNKHSRYLMSHSHYQSVPAQPNQKSLNKLIFKADTQPVNDITLTVLTDCCWLQKQLRHLRVDSLAHKFEMSLGNEPCLQLLFQKATGLLLSMTYAWPCAVVSANLKHLKWP